MKLFLAAEVWLGRWLSIAVVSDDDKELHVKEGDEFSAPLYEFLKGFDGGTIVFDWSVFPDDLLQCLSQEQWHSLDFKFEFVHFPGSAKEPPPQNVLEDARSMRGLYPVITKAAA